MTLLQIVGDACDEMGLDRPQGVVGNHQPQVRQLFALLRRLCADLVKQHDWQELVSIASVQSQSFVRSASTQQGSVMLSLNDGNGITDDFAVQGAGIQKGSTVVSVQGNMVEMSLPATATSTADVTFGRYRFDMPDDFCRMIDNTAWDKSTIFGMYGALSSQGWQAFNSAIANVGLNLMYRIRQGKLEITPTPLGDRSITYEYISNRFVTSGTERLDHFDADQNGTVFNHSLLVIGLMLMFRQANGLDATFELGQFQTLLAQLKAQDRPAPTINTSRAGSPALVGMQNTPDGSWNV